MRPSWVSLAIARRGGGGVGACCGRLLQGKGNSTPSSSQQQQQQQRPQQDTEELLMKLLAAERALAAQQELAGTLQRQLLLLERRMADAEDAAVAMQAQVAEARRAAGDVALKQQNVEVLVEQLEDRVLLIPPQEQQPQPALTPGDDSPAVGGSVRGGGGVEGRAAEMNSDEKDDDDDDEEETLEIAFSDELRGEIAAIIREMLKTEGAALLGLTGTQTHTPSSAQGAGQQQQQQPAALSPDDGVGAARVLEKLAALQAQVDELVLHKVDLTRVASLSLPPPPAAVEAAADRIAAQLRARGAVPFTDATGATRVASARVRISGVPPNFGAAEVREMCARVIADGRGPAEASGVEGEAVEEEEGIVSCVVRRGSGGGGERAFLVTLTHARLARQVIESLDGIVVHGHAPGSAAAGGRGMGRSASPPLGLRVEPVVSADVQAALHMMETQQQQQGEKEEKGEKGEKGSAAGDTSTRRKK